MARGGSEQSCIQGLVAVYERALSTKFVAQAKPDLQSDRKRPDALFIDGQGGALAAEHTLFHLAPRQAELEAKWRQAVDGLKELAPHRLFVTSIVCLRGLAAPWPKLRADLEECGTFELPRLSAGRAVVTLSRSALEMRVDAWTSDGARWIVRPEPAMPSGWTPAAEVNRLRSTIKEAEAKFSSAPGARHALLLHGDDPFNSSWEHYHQLVQALLHGGHPPDIDDLWLVETMPDQSGLHFYTALWSRRSDAPGRVWSAPWSQTEGLSRGLHWWPDRLR